MDYITLKKNIKNIAIVKDLIIMEIYVFIFKI